MEVNVEEIDTLIDNVDVKKLRSILSRFNNGNPVVVQSKFFKSNIFDKLVEKFLEIVEEEMRFFPGLSIFLKLIVNCVTKNEEVSMHFLKKYSRRIFDPSVFSFFSNSEKYNRQWVLINSILYYNLLTEISSYMTRNYCLIEDDEESEGEIADNEIIVLFKHMTRAEYVELFIESLYPSNSRTNEKQPDEVTEWVKYIIERLTLLVLPETIRYDTFELLLSRNTENKEERSNLVNILEVTEIIVNEKKYLPERFRNINSSKTKKEKVPEEEGEEEDDNDFDDDFETITEQELQGLENFFKRTVSSLHSVLKYIFITDKTIEKLVKSETPDVHERKEVSDIIYLSIKIISEMTDCKAIKKKRKEKSRICDDPILLELFPTMKKILTHVIQYSEMKRQSIGEEIGILVGVRSALIKIISDLAHENSTMQDEIRENDLIPFVLMFTKIDQNEPFLREWSLFCIKNLTFLNPKNQEYIKEFISMNATPTEQSVIDKNWEKNKFK